MSAPPSTREAVADAIARRHRRQTKARWYLFGALALLVVVLDQISKAVIRGQLDLRERHELTSWFSISRVNNEGIAFAAQSKSSHVPITSGGGAGSATAGRSPPANTIGT